MSEVLAKAMNRVGDRFDAVREEAIAQERARCAKLVCPDCAMGIYLEGREHIIETIQGNAAHSRACLAYRIWQPSS